MIVIGSGADLFYSSLEIAGSPMKKQEIILKSSILKVPQHKSTELHLQSPLGCLQKMNKKQNKAK